MPPFPSIPYPSAAAWVFPVAEISLYVLFVVCLLHARRRGVRHVSYLLGGVAFGLILEYVNVNANLGYTYGRFLVMFGVAPKDIPLCIGVGWGVIMYTARLCSDWLGLPLWAAAAADALLAISIDLSMDAVAYRLHMWHWDWTEQALDPLTAHWFGVPWGNFFGWLLVVFFYSSFSRLLERTFIRQQAARKLKLALVPLLAVMLAQVCLYLMLVHIGRAMHRYWGITSQHRFIVFMILLGVMVFYAWRRRNPAASPLPPIAWAIPVWFHCFFFILLFINGFHYESGGLLAASVMNFVIGVGVHVMAALPGGRGSQRLQDSAA